MGKVAVIGAGLAGSEAAFKIATSGFKVDLYEMRPVKPHLHTGQKVLRSLYAQTLLAVRI